MDHGWLPRAQGEEPALAFYSEQGAKKPVFRHPNDVPINRVMHLLNEKD